MVQQFLSDMSLMIENAEQDQELELGDFQLNQEAPPSNGHMGTI